jgi:hypothetical protein
MKKFAFAFVLATLAFPVIASAAPAPGSLRAACAADAQKLCSGMPWADQRKCLMTNSSKVSQDCGTALANARSATKEFRQACGADIKQYCGNTPAGPERRKCVVANKAQFSQPCQAVLGPR